VATRTRHHLKERIARLEHRYGRPVPPPADPFELVLLENCAYLVDDKRRATVFRRLRRTVGTRPDAILRTPLPLLADVIRDGGMLPLRRAEKLHTAADIALDVGVATLRRLVKRSPAEARKILKRFPGIGDPGADKILLFCRGGQGLGPDSNALRVLVRLGYGRESSDYPRTYRSAVEASAPELPTDVSWLIRAHQLLRRHGQEVCKRARPLCDRCPLTSGCRWYLARAAQSLPAGTLPGA